MNYCVNCGNTLQPGQAFCDKCGHPAQNVSYNQMYYNNSYPTQKNNYTTRLLVMLSLFFFVIISIAFTYSSVIDQEKEQRNEQQKQYESDYSGYEELDLKVFIKDKEENLSNAISKYEGNTYIFTAKVKSIEADYVEIQEEYYTIDVYFADSQKSKVNSLRKGDTITFYGKITDVDPLLFSYADIEEAIFIKIN